MTLTLTARSAVESDRFNRQVFPTVTSRNQYSPLIFRETNKSAVALGIPTRLAILQGKRNLGASLNRRNQFGNSHFRTILLFER